MFRKLERIERLQERFVDMVKPLFFSLNMRKREVKLPFAIH